MKELLTVREVAELLQLHEATIRRYIRDGKLESVRIGRRIRVPRAVLEKLMAPQVAEPASADEVTMLREAVVAYHVGGAVSKDMPPPSVDQIYIDLSELDDESLLKAGAYIAELRAEREKQERDALIRQIREEAHQLALERADWPREKVVEHFKLVADKILRQAIEKGTAIDGDRLDD